MHDILTIGHSSHPSGHFLGLLRRHGVEAVADVRSHPYSRYNPQFRKKAISSVLKDNGIAYVFLGRELGARSDNSECYVDGRVQYSMLAAEPAFEAGLQRLLAGAQRYRLALMCAEKEPLDCHRTILICRALRGRAGRLGHVLADGTLESHDACEVRLMALHGLSPDLLTSKEACIEEAYDRQAARIAYVSPDMR